MGSPEARLTCAVGTGLSLSIRRLGSPELMPPDARRPTPQAATLALGGDQRDRCRSRRAGRRSQVRVDGRIDRPLSRGRRARGGVICRAIAGADERRLAARPTELRTETPPRTDYIAAVTIFERIDSDVMHLILSPQRAISIGACQGRAPSGPRPGVCGRPSGSSSSVSPRAELSGDRSDTRSDRWDCRRRLVAGYRTSFTTASSRPSGRAAKTLEALAITKTRSGAT